MNPGYGMGYGRGFGRGRGRHFRGRGFGPYQDYFQPGWDYPPVPMAPSSPSNELDYLRSEAKALEEEMENIKKRIKNLEAEQKKESSK
jgi:hypothetical protein